MSDVVFEMLGDGPGQPASTPNVLFFQVAGEGLYHFVFDLWDLRAGNMRALDYAEANGISYIGQDEDGKVTIPVVVPPAQEGRAVGCPMKRTPGLGNRARQESD